MVTLAELAHAEAVLAECVAIAERDPAKDHNKYRSDIDGCKWKVTQIRRSLQAEGLLERSPEEAFITPLTQHFPELVAARSAPTKGGSIGRKLSPPTEAGPARRFMLGTTAGWMLPNRPNSRLSGEHEAPIVHPSLASGKSSLHGLDAARAIELIMENDSHLPRATAQGSKPPSALLYHLK